MSGSTLSEKVYVNDAPKKQTMQPTCSGTSVLGIKFKDGVVIAADMLVSYGSLARYMNFERLLKVNIIIFILKVNEKTVVACSGDMADYQFLKHHIMEQTHADNLLGDGFMLSRIDPLWNNYIVGGVKADGFPYLGYCSMLGISFTEDCVSTGFGSYLALPLLRRCISEVANNDINNLEENCAVDAVTEAMRQLYYRDCRAFDTYQLAIVRKDDCEIRGPLRLQSDWSIAEYVEGYD